MLWNRQLAEYLKSVIADFEADNDTTRALRRLHIKEVHMRRRGNHSGVRIVKQFKEMV